jgi:hypothetical protein
MTRMFKNTETRSIQLDATKNVTRAVQILVFFVSPALNLIVFINPSLQIIHFFGLIHYTPSQLSTST